MHGTPPPHTHTPDTFPLPRLNVFVMAHSLSPLPEVVMVIKGSLYATVTDGENHIQPKTCLQERDRGWSEGGVGGEQRAGRTGRAGLSDSY